MAARTGVRRVVHRRGAAVALGAAVFVDALRRNVPGRGGDVMNYVEQLIERGRREGRREGRLEGKIRTIEGLLERDISWSSIEAATGIDEAAFRKFKRQLDAADDGAT